MKEVLFDGRDCRGGEEGEEDGLAGAFEQERDVLRGNWTRSLETKVSAEVQGKGEDIRIPLCPVAIKKDFSRRYGLFDRRWG